MSSSEGENRSSNKTPASKRRRACDPCRKKRARCDGPEKPGAQCSGCAYFRLNCTYFEDSDRLTQSKKYIAKLECRVEQLDKVLQQLCPDESCYEEWLDSLEEATGDDNRSPTTSSSTSTMQFPPVHLFKPEIFDFMSKILRDTGGDSTIPPSQEDDVDPAIVFASSLHTKRFFGDSSEEMLARTALSVKEQYKPSGERPERPILSSRREEFWTARPWEMKIAPRPKYTFPEPDLAKDIIDLYFEHANLYLPLLHRPTFERSVRDGLHYTDAGFAEIFLLVCAIGARFSKDPRVRIDDLESQYSAGWKWYNQVECKNSFFSLPSLYDLQTYCLSIAFLQFSSSLQAVWVMIGTGIRLMQEVGIHRRKRTAPTVEDELWKRAFWVLIYIDRLVCLSFGRPLTLHDEEFDLEFPIECDDEYWEHPDPEKRFKQPPNKPSLISAFNVQLKLIKIMGLCSRMVYPPSKMLNHFAIAGTQWKAHIVPELDSRINRWLEMTPQHLRWDPNQPNDKFFRQSALLHALCYYTQISIHRPLLSSNARTDSLSIPSLAICTTAARACIRVADAQVQRGVLQPPIVQMAAFTSAIMLLSNIWSRKKAPSRRQGVLLRENIPDMEDVLRTLSILKTNEYMWPQAGKFWDVLAGLSSISEQPNRPLGQASDSTVPSFSLQSGPTIPHSPSLGLGMPEIADLPPVTLGADESFWNYAMSGLSPEWIFRENYPPLPETSLSAPTWPIVPNPGHNAFTDVVLDPSYIKLSESNYSRASRASLQPGTNVSSQLQTPDLPSDQESR
ncbi:unnamed protein product [Cyclocybe aegerita]|uniref:Zn(2)-C6 fungal-type domain-containing protein n=1 Tax=Cyclocybe aegerita TaxID=1973307 RepID=A0A8S0WYV9_CYCAE|nr:unnamed protein product [Cyclocybe aegerita]